ncbi:unnamed protein product [Euphydryas editha]|uniref:Endonuclease/exonuclease/phosphatase domain-containing protein n=1 Tax=Euphydryas editha TaxID=104508 RepID=A0AAU9U1H0_EUPED|nr:unnamed protein product [Euphydryas editha]
MSVYRPPKFFKQDKIKDFLFELRNLLDNIPRRSKVIFCGDININILNKYDNNVILYENTLAEFGFTKCICDVTRREILKNNLVESCIDHIYIRAPLASIDSAVIRHKIADHYFISAAIQWNRASDVYRAQQIAANQRVLDNRLVRHKLQTTNFDKLLEINCPVQLYNSFTNIFTNIYDECYKLRPVIKNVSNRNNKNWINDNLKRMISERDRLFNVWCNDPKNMIKRLTYTKYRNKCNKAIFKRKVEYDKQSILDCNNNIKKVWDKINNLLGHKRQPLDSIITSNLEGHGSVKEICDKFANNFTNEVNKIKHVCSDKLMIRDNYVKRSDMCMRWQPVSENEVKRVINKLSKNKAPGSDLVRMSDCQNAT